MTPGSTEPLFLPVLPSIIGFFVMLSISLVALSRGWRNPTNFLFFAIVFLGALINLDVALISIVRDKSLALTIDRMTYLFFVFSPPVYVQFVHSFLGLKKRKLIEYFAYGLSIVCLFFVPTKYFIPRLQQYDFGTIAQAGPAFHGFSVLVAFAVLYCLATLYDGMKKATDNNKKNRIKYILLGMGLSALLISLNILPVSGIAVYPPSNFSFVPALFLAYGFLKYDLFDIGAVLRKSAGYLLLTGMLAGIYFVAILTLNFIFWGAFRLDEVTVPLLFVLAVVIFFNPIKNSAQNLIDRFFFRGKYDYQPLLRDISERLTALMSVADIGRLLIDFLTATFNAERAELLLAEAGGLFREYTLDEQGRLTAGKGLSLDGAARSFLGARKTPLTRLHLETKAVAEPDRMVLQRLFAQLDASLVVPLISRDQVIGLFRLGQKKSGELFVPEDLSLLSTLANQAAIALENAKSYEQLEIFSRELEKTVELRTAALRTALAEKERAQQRLIQAESLAGIGRLAAGVAHELNNPLAAGLSLVQTSIEAIERDDLGEEGRAEVVDDLRFTIKELKRAAEIVQSLLGVSRQRENYTEPVDINRVLEDSLRILYSQYKHQEVEIDKTLDESIPLIEGNFAELGQVMINIIKNALQSLPAGRGRIALKTYRQDATVFIEISDTGRGMSSVEIGEIFNPFYTTKPVGEGVGLGLYISHSILERHGGEIAVESRLGHGSTFTVALPIKRSEQ